MAVTGSVYINSECLSLPNAPPIEQLMFLAYKLYQSGESESDIMTDVMLEYDYDKGVICVNLAEVNSNMASQSVPNNVMMTVHDEYSQIGYGYGYIVEEETQFQYCGQQEGLTTTTTTIGTSVEFQQKFRKSNYTKNWISQSKESKEVHFGSNRGGFYAERLTKHCVFCRKNGEPLSLYKTHVLRENGSVTCPVLRKYVCPVCSATGDVAHTLKHCPKNKGESAVVGRHELSRSGRNARGILGKTYRYD